MYAKLFFSDNSDPAVFRYGYCILVCSTNKCCQSFARVEQTQCPAPAKSAKTPGPGGPGAQHYFRGQKNMWVSYFFL
jgi:hypothetical protein